MAPFSGFLWRRMTSLSERHKVRPTKAWECRELLAAAGSGACQIDDAPQRGERRQIDAPSQILGYPLEAHVLSL